jgi:uncharacterized protein YndB with AHSA1/START domain
VTGQPGVVVTLEGRVGGRIFERAADGVEHDWGEVTVWEPPRRLAYLWHLGQHADTATEVDIRFRAAGVDLTRIQIVHAGWERFGDAAQVLRERNRAGWDTVLPRFTSALIEGEG